MYTHAYCLLGQKFMAIFYEAQSVCIAHAELHFVLKRMVM
jgi:hypothetical protein